MGSAIIIYLRFAQDKFKFRKYGFNKYKYLFDG